MKCRGCKASLDPDLVFCDLGAQPLANGLLTKEQLGDAGAVYPLRPLICDRCQLVQLPWCPPPASIFTPDYPFYAGQSRAWRAHCAQLADMCQQEFGLTGNARVLDIGSNDGTLLRAFKDAGVPALGVEPCAGPAQHAQMKGLATVQDWWGVAAAKKLSETTGQAPGAGWGFDIVVGTNVLAHVPDLFDFLTGVNMVLKPDGIGIFEVPWLGAMLQTGQFDQIYAEHHSYFSLYSLRETMKLNGLRVCGAEFLPNIHGGSLRVFVDRGSDRVVDIEQYRLLTEEEGLGLNRTRSLRDFTRIPPMAKWGAWQQLLPHAGKVVVGYGASAKAAVSLNYFGMGPDTITVVADTTQEKWGKHIPGVRTPIVPDAMLRQIKPDVVVNFCWNWKEQSEERIKELCPGAEIVYFHSDRSPLLKAVA